MKERPILFSAPMVCALLDGSKTQTRRIVKNLSRVHPDIVYLGGGVDDDWWPYQSDDGESIVCGDGNEHPMACPYGKAGDRLWVRETWARDDEDGQLVYRADVGQGGDADDWERNRRDGVPRFRWTPAIHMPRTASRITLEVTDVRVERLQDISEADAWSEGCAVDADGGARCAAAADPTARDWYADLWEDINGAGSWDANPWVWVVEFRRIKP